MRLDDGYQSEIAIAGITNKFYEKTVQPPGWKGGDAIDTTTMRNTKYRTKAPRSLMELSEMKLKVAYNSTMLDTTYMSTIINVNKSITITFPDHSTLQFWGYVQEFTPDDLTIGEQAEADMTIIPTMTNGSGVETDPVYTPAP